MAATICRRSFSGDIEFTEASPVLEDIKLIVDLGLTPFVIEFDSVNIINLISWRIINNLEIDWVIYDIRALICNKSLFVVKHVRGPVTQWLTLLLTGSLSIKVLYMTERCAS